MKTNEIFSHKVEIAHGEEAFSFSLSLLCVCMTHSDSKVIFNRIMLSSLTFPISFPLSTISAKTCAGMVRAIAFTDIKPFPIPSASKAENGELLKALFQIQVVNWVPAAGKDGCLR